MNTPTNHEPQRESTVYVLQDDGTKNLLPARRFGKVITFTGRDMPTFNQTWVDTLESWLADYKPYRDHLLLIGDPVLIAMAGAIIGRKWDNVQLLKWDRQERCYISNRFYLEVGK